MDRRGLPSKRSLRIGAGATFVLAVLAGLLALAPAALAHHPEISGSVACHDDPQGYEVSFTSESWQKSGGDGGGGANPDIAVLYRLRTDDGAPGGWVELPADAAYKYSAANGYDFEDAFFIADLSGGNRIQLRARADGTWGNGQAGGQHRDSDWIDFPDDCQRPGVPEVSVSQECTDGDGTVTVALSNTGGDLPVTFVVTHPVTQATTQRVVQPGLSTTVELGDLPDGAHTIEVTANGLHDDQSVTVDCDRPGVASVTATTACDEGDGTVTVSLSNTGGDLPVTFVVTHPVTKVTTQKVVPPGQSATVVLGDLPDGPTTVGVTADGLEMDQPVTVTCDRPGVPQVSSSVACDEGDGTVTVSLSNTGGDLPVTFVVTHPVTKVTTQKVVPPGQSATVVLGDLPDGPTTVGVTADGSSRNQSLTVDCDRPGVPQVSSSVACDEGDGTVTVSLSNTGGDLPVTFVVTHPVTKVTTQKVVPPGQSATVVLGDLPDGPTTVGVTADGSSRNQSLTVECDEPGVPSVSTDAACQDFDGTVAVTLANTGGTEPIVFVVTNPGSAPVTRTVDVGGSTTVTFTGLPDGARTIAVTADGAPLPQQLTVDCDRPGTPAVFKDVACTELGGEVTITLANGATAGSAEPVTFVVTNPTTGTTATRVVAAGANAEVVFDGLPEGTTSVPVSADGVAVAPVVVEVDCQQPEVVSAVVVCAKEGSVVTLRNQGGTPVDLTVRRDGEPVETVSVPAASSVEVLVPLEEDQTATVTVLDGEELLETLTVTVDCEQVAEVTTSTTASTVVNPSSTAPGETTTTVGGRSVPAAGSSGGPSGGSGPSAIGASDVATPVTGTLPLTGGRSLPLLGLAGLLTLAGGALLVASRRVA